MDGLMHVKLPVHCGMNLTWSWHMILIMGCWILLTNILLRILCLCLSGIWACNFLYLSDTHKHTHTYLYKTFLLKPEKYIFKCTWNILKDMIDHTHTHTHTHTHNPTIFKRIKIISSIFVGYKCMKLDINYRKYWGKKT